MDMDLSSMWVAEELEEMEDVEFMNKQYDHKMKPAAYNINKSTTAAADYLSPEIYTDTESCFTDKWLSTPTSNEKQPIEMKLPAGATYHQKAADNTSSQKLSVTNTLISSSNTFTISFGDLNNPKHDDIIPTIFDDSSLLGRRHETADGNYSGKLIQANAARTALQTQDHVVAERKRREKLNRHFISLSALLPNLKKMDKATVLEDAINYIKQLQERVKELEELSGVKRKDATKCVIALKRSTLSNGDDHAGSSSNDTNSDDDDVVDDDDDDDSRVGDVTCKSSAAEIEVRMSGSCVLVRIYSHKDSSFLVKVLDKMQNQGLSIISSSVMPFSNNTTLIAVVAQIESEFSMTAADLVKNLQLTL